MLSLKWFASLSIITVFGSFIIKITLSSVVLAKDTVSLMPSSPAFLKTISPNLIAQRQSRFALVIGNADYKEGALANPVNDATDVAQALQDLGFEVTLLQNKDLQSMEDAVENFSHQLRKDGVGVFYFAGHGIEVGGENYLIPVNAKLLREKDVRYEGMALGTVLNAMTETEGHISIVIIDACRENPFYRRWPSTQRSSNSVRGLTKVDSPPQGTVIAFAAAPNQSAEDGSGRNSPFTSNLLRYIKEPNLDIVLMFRKVREGVLNETQKEQEPRYQETLVGGSFYFNEVTALPSQPSPTLVNIPQTQPNSTPVTTPQSEPSPSLQITATAFNSSGVNKYNARDYQGAISDFNQAIKLKPDDAIVYYNRGASKRKSGDYQGAIADYSQAIKLKPDFAVAYNNRGFVKYNLKDYQGAIADYDQAIKIKPDYTDAYENKKLAQSEIQNRSNFNKKSNFVIEKQFLPHR
ncbi:MAG: caspase family protein [Snowella sp.]|nr:caspase family protein [Snowella sp.]